MAENQVMTLARKYADAVRSVMDTQEVILYGSQARGTATDHSDIDIAVVVNQISGDYLDAVSLLWKLTRSVSPEIEPVLLSSSDQDNGFLRTVLQTGIAV